MSLSWTMVRVLADNHDFDFVQWHIVECIERVFCRRINGLRFSFSGNKGRKTAKSWRLKVTIKLGLPAVSVWSFNVSNIRTKQFNSVRRARAVWSFCLLDRRGDVQPFVCAMSSVFFVSFSALPLRVSLGFEEGRDHGLEQHQQCRRNGRSSPRPHWKNDDRIFGVRPTSDHHILHFTLYMYKKVYSTLVVYAATKTL